MKFRAALTIAALLVTGSLFGLGSSAYAFAGCQAVFKGPGMIDETAVIGIGVLVCEDPKDNTGLLVNIQSRASGSTTWLTVASGVGEARFPCAGTDLRQYRLQQVPLRVLTFKCS
jgi:hypothetical protein